MSEPIAPAGWYPDPDDPSRRRYWDGGTWSAPPPGSEPAAAGGTRPLSVTASPLALLQILVGILLAVAPLLPWVKLVSGFGSASRSGLDYSSDGAVLLVIGLLVVVTGVGTLAGWGGRWSTTLAGVIGGGAGFALAVYDLHQVNQKVDAANAAAGEFANASVGAGLILALVASVLLILNGILALWRARRAKPSVSGRSVRP